MRAPNVTDLIIDEYHKYFSTIFKISAGSEITLFLSISYFWVEIEIEISMRRKGRIR